MQAETLPRRWKPLRNTERFLEESERGRGLSECVLAPSERGRGLSERVLDDSERFLEESERVLAGGVRVRRGGARLTRVGFFSEGKLRGLPLSPPLRHAERTAQGDEGGLAERGQSRFPLL